jgi:hypothetical protein
MKLTREELERLQQAGARVKKEPEPKAQVPAPPREDHTVLVRQVLDEVQEMEARFEASSAEQLRRLETLIARVTQVKPAQELPAQPKVQRLKVNRDANGFIESVDIINE